MVVYFSPSDAAAELALRMSTLVRELESLSVTESTLIVAGDLNLPHIDWPSGTCPGMTGTGESIENRVGRFERKVDFSAWSISAHDRLQRVVYFSAGSISAPRREGQDRLG